MQARPLVCAHCGKERSATNPLSRCSQCRLVWYCKDGGCQRAAWPTHRTVCQSVEAQAATDPVEELLREGADANYRHAAMEGATPLLMSAAIPSGNRCPRPCPVAGQVCPPAPPARTAQALCATPWEPPASPGPSGEGQTASVCHPRPPTAMPRRCGYCCSLAPSRASPPAAEPSRVERRPALYVPNSRSPVP